MQVCGDLLCTKEEAASLAALHIHLDTRWPTGRLPPHLLLSSSLSGSMWISGAPTATALGPLSALGSGGLFSAVGPAVRSGLGSSLCSTVNFGPVNNNCSTNLRKRASSFSLTPASIRARLNGRLSVIL
ncbi:unnamed protein product [Protopolystoma xenopodis]|uniref:Uncharacterized protein n=1 Tax=Protopolystoma xenopodis TaxID=117903 RepID=A0A448WPQ7_9PLAT|nr:unnamed protein product [Protopolystoma xenopodis]